MATKCLSWTDLWRRLGRIIYAKPPFKLCCSSNMKCCRIPPRCLEEKLGGQTTATEQSEIPKHTVRVGFLLSWLASNLYRLMERNGHVFVLRLHKFLHSSDRWRLRKICCSPCSFLSVPIKEIKRKLRLFCCWTHCVRAYAERWKCNCGGCKTAQKTTHDDSNQTANKQKLASKWIHFINLKARVQEFYI